MSHSVVSALRAHENVAQGRRFSVFISARSLDYPFAQQVFDFLSGEGITSFFAPDSIPAVGMSEYGHVINTALEEVAHLVVVTSQPSHVMHDTAPWVHYEWATFHSLLLRRRGRGNIVTVLCQDAEAGALPIPLSTRYQAIRLANLDQLLAFVGPNAAASALPSASSEQADAMLPAVPLPDAVPTGPSTALTKLRGLPGRTGPVPPNAVFAKLVKHFAEVFSQPAVATGVLTWANVLRAEADPELSPNKIVVPPADLPEPGVVPARTFWQSAWALARLKGARTVGSFLLSAEEEQDAYPKALDAEVSRFVDLLHHIEQAPKPS